MIEHFKKYWGWYTLAAAAIITGIVVACNWDKWFGNDDQPKNDQAGDTQAPVNADKSYIISSADGAIVYFYDNGIFSQPENPQRLPQSTEIKILSLSPDKKFAETVYGWININDISVVDK